MDERVLRELGDELMRLARRRAHVYPGARLDPSAFRLLWLLTEGPPRTLRELAEELQLDPSTVNRQVNAAIGHGLVERYAVPDSPSRLLRPTEAGRAAYVHDGTLRAAVYDEVLKELGRDRAEALVAELRELNDGLDRAHSRLRPEPPPG
ncbi:winged helix-turn-helix transcriptional regulator [Nocardioides anomalus]|uniref:Winged helix-turn-helix transcriptional regulator n=1 Tax=Nocardioides anomalus TaxID=2712223 RepID=A0A6G6WGA1_9ACTN|nr:MarR family winged helix-turn-helix transcriptional regulator [Nocardioides anomalus]QIG44262.1 winged helix-turn-helix transcriptional regulator [Nocardioides anomalus]